ncbi:hypothetical protein DFH06DRAFT_645582 [Mycena polygramma]|nr:hypothetical protein DFH06DRAFT_645582 [Mycena polygramma]
MQLCEGPESSLYEFVVSICKWPKQEARLILLELVASTSDVDRPCGWKLERLYDFLMAIIQFKAEWRRLVAEAALLLDKTSPPVIPHPIHLIHESLLSESSDSLPSISDNLVPPHPRPPSIQESLFSESPNSKRTTTDTSTVWGPGTLSGRALLALGEAAIRGIDAIIIRRRLATIRLRAPLFLTKSMHGDLLELCRCAQFPRPNMHSVTIRKQAIDLTLAQICAGPQSSLYMFVVFLCQWPKQEARLTLLELVGSTSEVNRPLGWKLERFYDLLVAIIQVKGGWRRIVAEAAILLDKTSPLVITHPIHLVFAEVMTDLAKSPLQQTSTTFA